MNRNNSNFIQEKKFSDNGRNIVKNKKFTNNDILYDTKVDFSKLRFLVVDDYKAFLTLHKNMLLNAGALAVDTASGGDEAINIFSRSEVGYYDVILTDVNMCDMYEYCLTESVREMQRADSQNVIIIALTCQPFTRNILNEGIDDLHIKPLNTKLLEMQLCKHLKVHNI